MACGSIYNRAVRTSTSRKYKHAATDCRKAAKTGVLNSESVLGSVSSTKYHFSWIPDCWTYTQTEYRFFFLLLMLLETILDFRFSKFVPFISSLVLIRPSLRPQIFILRIFELAEFVLSKTSSWHLFFSALWAVPRGTMLPGTYSPEYGTYWYHS